MDTYREASGRNGAGRGGSRLLWLRDPGDGNDSGPVMCRPGELGELVTAALVEAGLVDLAVEGEVSRLRDVSARTTFDLVECPIEEACSGGSRLHVVLEAADGEQRDTAVADGMAVRVWGQLHWGSADGCLRLVAGRVDRSDLARP